MIGYAQNVVPEDATAIWGARAILNRGFVDIVHNRQSMVGEARQELADRLNAGILHRARIVIGELHNAGVIRSDIAEDFILYQDDTLVLIGNTNASHGYLYLTAFLVPEVRG